MAEIMDCVGKKIKISKNSITIKNDDGKTCGVVRNTVSLYDMQSNKQIEYYKKVEAGFKSRVISMKDCIIKDGEMYVFRNIKSKLFYEKHGYFSGLEEKKAKEKEVVYNAIKESGIKVIEYIPA